MNDKKHVHISIDHGNKLQKVVFDDPEVDDLVFESGLHVSTDEPVSNKNTIRFNGKYYTVGSGRIPVQLDKSESVETFAFSLACIGYFMRVKGLSEASVTLSVGLPLLHYTDQRDTFKAYLERSNIEFDYEDLKGLSVTIRECFVWPQGYSGYLRHEVRSAFINTDVIFIDIGAVTIDCGLASKTGLLDPMSVVSLDIGIIQLYKRIQSKLFRKGLSISEGQIDQILLKEKPVLFDDEIVNLVEDEARFYVNTVIGTLAEQFELKMNAVYFMGGASTSLADYISSSDKLRYFEIEESITSNANGYLSLTKALIKKRNCDEKI